MSNERSPNYPSLALEDAVRRVKLLFEREKRASVAPEVAVKAWGYKGLNGSNRSYLGALRQYGLLETDHSGGVRVSRRGLTIAMQPSSSPEYASALREAALAPRIFRELHESKAGASDDALRYYLVSERGFSLDGAKRVIEAYRSTVEVANLDETRYSEDTEEDFDVPDTSRQDGYGPTGDPVRPQVEQSYRVPLSNGVTAEVTFQGNKVTRRELQLLRRYLELAELALDDDSANAQGSGADPAASAGEHRKQT